MLRLAFAEITETACIKFAIREMFEVVGWRKKGKLVGVAVIRLGTTRWHLCYYCIDEAFRGKGIGSKFLKKIVKKAENRTLTLEANASLRAFYERFGFNTFGFDDEFYWMYKSHKHCASACCFT
jgi:predicted GNAT family N-acyltransferase